MAIEVGMVLGAQSEMGLIQFSVASIEDDSVTVDFNHQMAGKTLTSAKKMFVKFPSRRTWTAAGPRCGCA